MLLNLLSKKHHKRQSTNQQDIEKASSKKKLMSKNSSTPNLAARCCSAKKKQKPEGDGEPSSLVSGKAAASKNMQHCLDSFLSQKNICRPSWSSVGVLCPSCPCGWVLRTHPAVELATHNHIASTPQRLAAYLFKSAGTVPTRLALSCGQA